MDAVFDVTHNADYNFSYSVTFKSVSCHSVIVQQCVFSRRLVVLNVVNL